MSAAAGVVCLAAEGDAVGAGQALLELHTEDASLLPGALAALEGGFDIVPAEPEAGAAARGPAPLVLDRVAAHA